jgi:hypothetical protein
MVTQEAFLEGIGLICIYCILMMRYGTRFTYHEESFTWNTLKSKSCVSSWESHFSKRPSALEMLLCLHAFMVCMVGRQLNVWPSRFLLLID